MSVCYDCGKNDNETEIVKCSYFEQKYKCSECGHSEMMHDHYVCYDCGELCGNCQEWFCCAKNRKCGMEVCDDCALYNG